MNIIFKNIAFFNLLKLIGLSHDKCIFIKHMLFFKTDASHEGREVIEYARASEAW